MTTITKKMQSYGGGIVFNAFIGTAALLLVIVLWATNPPPPRNYAQYVNITSTFYNVTAGGVCGFFNMSILVTHIGRQVTMQIPYFVCNGTINPGDLGVYFPLPAGLDSAVPFPLPNLVDPFPSEYVTWCSAAQELQSVVPTVSLSEFLPLPNEKVIKMTSSGNTTTITTVGCTGFVETNSYIFSGTVVMGVAVTTQLPVPESETYGPWYGHTLIYTSVTAAAPLLVVTSGSASKMMLATLGAGLAVATM